MAMQSWSSPSAAAAAVRAATPARTGRTTPGGGPDPSSQGLARRLRRRGSSAGCCRGRSARRTRRRAGAAGERPARQRGDEVGSRMFDRTSSGSRTAFEERTLEHEVPGFACTSAQQKCAYAQGILGVDALAAAIRILETTGKGSDWRGLPPQAGESAGPVPTGLRLQAQTLRHLQPLTSCLAVAAPPWLEQARKRTMMVWLPAPWASQRGGARPACPSRRVAAVDMDT